MQAFLKNIFSFFNSPLSSILPLLIGHLLLRITQLFYELSLSMGRQKYKLFLIRKAFFEKIFIFFIRFAKH